MTAWLTVLALPLLAPVQAGAATVSPTVEPWMRDQSSSPPAQPSSSSTSGVPPAPTDEVEAILKELERESGVSATAVNATAEEHHPSMPAWLDQVVPVLELRLKPTLLMGHPTARDRPALRGELRGRLGAEVHPTTHLSMRVVLSGNQLFPALRAPGPDLVHDAWVQWSYSALGGNFRLRAGRQGVVLSSLTAFGNNEFELVEPRFDGLTARWNLGPAFTHVVAVTEALQQWPNNNVWPEINGLVMVQAGVEDGPRRQLEAHALVGLMGLPVHGDAGPHAEKDPLLDLGGNAMWEWRGLMGRFALDLQQSRFAAPSIYAPAFASHISAGYAPEFPWAQGVYVEAGARGAFGQPMKYVGVLSGWNGWKNVTEQPFEPLYGERHGMQGEMDLVGLRNMYDVFARVGLRRGLLTNLAVTFHRLSLLDPRAEWKPATGDRLLLRAEEGGSDPEIGYEVDIHAHAELTRHVRVAGSVGLLHSGAKAREAGFGALAQTAFIFLEARL